MAPMGSVADRPLLVGWPASRQADSGRTDPTSLRPRLGRSRDCQLLDRANGSRSSKRCNRPWSYRSAISDAKRWSLGRSLRKRQYTYSSSARTVPFRAASPSGRKTGMARHIAANASAPCTKFPSSQAWRRASISSWLTGQSRAFAAATSTKSIAPRRSRRRIK